jgi:hypothetical protein
MSASGAEPLFMTELLGGSGGSTPLSAKASSTGTDPCGFATCPFAQKGLSI